MASHLAVWIWSGLLLQDIDAIPPVHPVKVVPQYASGTGQPLAPLKLVLTLLSVPGEVELI